MMGSFPTKLVRLGGNDIVECHLSSEGSNGYLPKLQPKKQKSACLLVKIALEKVVRKSGVNQGANYPLMQTICLLDQLLRRRKPFRIFT